MLPRFLFGFALLFSVATSHAADDETGWSKPVNGLRGRLLVHPASGRDAPFCRIYVEFQNVTDTLGNLKVPFSVDKVVFQVADQAGKATPPSPAGPYSNAGLEPEKFVAIPFDGTLRFRISFPGLGYDPADKSIIDLGRTAVWVIPQNGKQFHLSGVFTIAPKTSWERSWPMWNGTLEFPPVLIPAPK